MFKCLNHIFYNFQIRYSTKAFQLVKSISFDNCLSYLISSSQTVKLLMNFDHSFHPFCCHLNIEGDVVIRHLSIVQQEGNQFFKVTFWRCNRLELITKHLKLPFEPTLLCVRVGHHEWFCEAGQQVNTCVGDTAVLKYSLHFFQCIDQRPYVAGNLNTKSAVKKLMACVNEFSGILEDARYSLWLD